MREPYAPRRRARLAPVEMGGAAFRVHWIDVEGEGAPPEEVQRAALAHARGVLPGAMAAEGRAGGRATSSCTAGARACGC